MDEKAQDLSEEPAENTKREAEKILREVTSNLPEKQRQIILLKYYYEEMSLAEISQILGMNKSTVRVYHGRALKVLKSHPLLKPFFE